MNIQNFKIYLRRNKQMKIPLGSSKEVIKETIFSKKNQQSNSNKLNIRRIHGK